MILGRKPIMSAEIERQIMNAVMMYNKRVIWKKWGLHNIRKQGVAILLVGPPGTGKTTIAEYLALKIRRKGIKEVSFADFGSHIPGENARQIKKIFHDARENGEMTIYLDDCEAVLWDRSRAGSTAMWMLEVIDELLIQIGKYPGLTILATNMPKILDPALDRRILATIYVGIPAIPERFRLWEQKMPSDYPIKLSIAQREKLSTLVLTGAEVENVIIETSADALREDTKPTFEMLYQVAAETAQRRVDRETHKIATLQQTYEGAQ
jgi:SpoVK/Ycf46/Vps4 family AAA+-type ATPase